MCIAVILTSRLYHNQIATVLDALANALIQKLIALVFDIVIYTDIGNASHAATKKMLSALESVICYH